MQVSWDIGASDTVTLTTERGSFEDESATSTGSKASCAKRSTTPWPRKTSTTSSRR